MAEEKKTGEERIVDDKDLEKATGGDDKAQFSGASCPNCGEYFQFFPDYRNHLIACK